MESFAKLADCYKSHVGKVLQLEILPACLFELEPNSSTSSQLLEDGLDIGIGKDLLLQAFPIARALLLSNQQLENPPHDQVMIATQIILTLDGEHLTAANFRKRHLLALKQRFGHSSPEIRSAVSAEMAMLTSFLTSPLWRHTKSPNLWHHRRWLLKYSYVNLLDPRTQEERAVINNEAFCMAEISVVMKASERHPLNYYAWTYARSLIMFLEREGALSISSSSSFGEHLVNAVYSWCARYPRDTSGWSFLGLLLRRLGTHDVNKSVVRQSLDLAFKFNWDYDSFWSFVRIVLASKTVLTQSERALYLSDIRSRLRDWKPNGIAKMLSWIGEENAEQNLPLT